MSGLFYVCIIMIELQLAEQQFPPYRKSARVGSSNPLHPCHLQESLDSNVRIFYVCIIMIELQLAEQQLPPYRKSAPVGRLKLVTLAIFKKASTAM
ncbi:hypothetical protein C0W96_20255 [Photobacterium kishitanii]|nr:hypothetical protein C0W96_20255 [Photobacterium kishitanii]PSV72984.1 hypothetical protein C0W29_19335 [Photobacterium kishitanii]